jgi:hypothetical protein
MSPEFAASGSSGERGANPIPSPAVEQTVAMLAAPAAPMWRRLGPLAVLALIVVVASTLRFRQLGDQGMWLDELITLQFTTGRHDPLPFYRPGPLPDLTETVGARPWWSLWFEMGGEAHPPGYPILLRLWRELWGPGDIAARSFSVVASLAAILLLFDVARLLYGTTPALWAAAIMTAAATQIAYAQDTRPYTLIIALVLGAASAVLRLKVRGPGLARASALGMCLLALPLMHYLSLGACLAIGVYAIIGLRGRALRQALAAMVIAAAVFAIAWVPFMLEQRNNVAQVWLDDAGNHGQQTLLRLALLPTRYLGLPRFDTAGLAEWLLVVLGAAVYIVPLFFVRRRRDMELGYLLLVCTVGSVLALDLVRRTQLLAWVRYTLAASPGVVLLVVGVSSRLKASWLQHALPAVALGYALWSVPEPHLARKLAYREIAATIARHAAGEELVVFTPTDPPWMRNSIALALCHYQPGAVRLALTPNNPTPLTGRRQAWAVSYGPLPGRILPGWSAERVEDVEVMFHIWRLTRSAAAPATSPH